MVGWKCLGKFWLIHQGVLHPEQTIRTVLWLSEIFALQHPSLPCSITGCKEPMWSVLLFSCSVLPDSLQPHRLQPTRLLCPWDFPGRNTRVGCHFLLQGTFPAQGLNPHLLCVSCVTWIGRWILCCLATRVAVWEVWDKHKGKDEFLRPEAGGTHQPRSLWLQKHDLNSHVDYLDHFPL